MKKPKYGGWWILLLLPGVITLNIRNGNTGADAFIPSIFAVGFFMLIDLFIYLRKIKEYNDYEKRYNNFANIKNDNKNIDTNSNMESNNSDCKNNDKKISDINNSQLKEEFKNFLILKGYKEFTNTGSPSTVYDYLGRIDFIMKNENYTSWYYVAKNIDSLVKTYGETGEKSQLGKKSHNAVINALKRFQEFIISKE